MNTHALDTARERTGDHARHHERRMGPYARFAAMIATATALGYAAMYMNTYEPGHVYWSWTRFYMSMIMAGVMIPTMLFFMKHMYADKRRNAAVLAVAAALFVGGLAWCARRRPSATWPTCGP